MSNLEEMDKRQTEFSDITLKNIKYKFNKTDINRGKKNFIIFIRRIYHRVHF